MSSFWPSPILFQIGPLSIHWYGLAYAITFLLAYFIFHHSRPGRALPLDENQKDNLLIALIAGIILGARFGYIIFYNAAYYLADPIQILAVWKGGLSFHGGVIGTAIAALLYISWHRRKHHKTTHAASRSHDSDTTASTTATHPPLRALRYQLSASPVSFFQITDIAVLITPIGIFLGRLGNFINAELFGRISPDTRFCLNFPSDPANCRYPSQLFESATEGLLLGIIMFALSRHLHRSGSDKPGQLSAIFLILYGIIRFVNEYFREPDAQLGFIANIPGISALTMGQILSAALVLAGGIMWILIRKTARRTKN